MNAEINRIYAELKRDGGVASSHDLSILIEYFDSCAVLRAEVERLKENLRIAARFILKDHEGKAVSQGAFNGLEAHYYEFLSVVSRIEKEGLVKALREGSQWKDGENTRESWTYESLATIAIAYLLGKEKP